MRRLHLNILVICSFLLLAGCGLDLGYLTDAEIGQTAVAQGCWSEDKRPTPFPVTVTLPGGTPTRTATVITNPGEPTRTPAPSPTRRPTITPLPRCTPQPGQTQMAWPTPPATEPPYPTKPANAIQPQTSGEDVMRLPNAVLVMDAAVHPNQSWPAVAAIDIPVMNKADARLYVRVYNPSTNRWSLARTVDGAGSHPGDRFRNVAISITPDGTVHVMWGATTYPKMQLFYSRSSDYGETWTAPEEVVAPYFAVIDMATTSSNELYALAVRPDGPVVVPMLLHRSSSGAWSSESLPIRDDWYASSGALTVVGDGESARIVGMITGQPNKPGLVTTFSRPLLGNSWQTARHYAPDATRPLATGRVVAYTYRANDVQHQAVTFSATARDGAALYTLTSLDAGETWGSFIPVVVGSGLITSGGVAYDPLAQRLVAVWNCCADSAWGNGDSTHYAAWSDPTGGSWTPAANTGIGGRPPLVTKAKSAALTHITHAVNARIAWLVWLEDGQLIRARSYSLDRIIPRDQYPTPTRASVPTAGGQP